MRFKSGWQIRPGCLSDTACLFILLATLLLLSACSHQPHVVKQTDISAPGPVDIYIVRQGWHTGLIVPASTIQSRLPKLYERFADTPYLEFGWGDRGYYEAEDVSIGLTIQAALWPTDSVMRVIAIPERPDMHFAGKEIETLCLDENHYALLLGFIENSFYKDSDGRIIDSKDGFEGDSQFYQATGDYYLMNTCNTWTAKGLKTAGLDISPAFKSGAGSIERNLSRQKKKQVLRACP